jgi:pimeloyl-ACP methyl ester carboxylesterase
MLEVIDKGSCSEAHPPPLLFVHGSWHGAWCWAEHFLDFFADKGYRAVALPDASGAGRRMQQNQGRFLGGHGPVWHNK